MDNIIKGTSDVSKKIGVSDVFKINIECRYYEFYAKGETDHPKPDVIGHISPVPIMNPPQYMSDDHTGNPNYTQVDWSKVKSPITEPFDFDKFKEFPVSLIYRP
jgi:hypothetical protein